MSVSPHDSNSPRHQPSPAGEDAIKDNKSEPLPSFRRATPHEAPPHTPTKPPPRKKPTDSPLSNLSPDPQREPPPRLLLAGRHRDRLLGCTSRCAHRSRNRNRGTSPHPPASPRPVRGAGQRGGEGPVGAHGQIKAYPGGPGAWHRCAGVGASHEPAPGIVGPR